MTRASAELTLTDGAGIEAAAGKLVSKLTLDMAGGSNVPLAR